MNTITPKDIKRLQKSRTKAFRVFVPLFLFAAALLYLVIGLWNLRLCTRIAEYGGMAFSEVFSGWIQGVDLSLSYSGAYLAAIERLSTGMLEIGIVIPLIIAGVGFIINNRRNQRILAYIESKENEA